jgi:hypothetical protein
MNSSPSNTSMPKETSKSAAPPQSTPAADDLFGAPEKPSNTGNDLFGPSTDTKAAPAKAAPTFESSAPAEPKLAPPAEKPSAPAGDDLFGAPSNEPAAPAEKPAAPAEGEKAPADKDKKKDDDLFGGFGAILREPGGLASNDMRHWVDDTGRFTCEGRLTKVLDGKVQLLKDNGHTSTVPLSRLSQVDLSFVYRQASAERSQSGVQTAQYTPAGR